MHAMISYPPQNTPWIKITKTPFDILDSLQIEINMRKEITGKLITKKLRKFLSFQAGGEGFEPP